MTRRLRSRRGSALILVLLMTLAVAALAIAAIFMSSSASLLSRFYDKERQFEYAAQSGIARVISRLELDTTLVINATAPSLALTQTTLADAAGSALSGVTVRVWAARTGDTTTSGPLTISLLAQVSDASGTRYVKRSDLRRYHFGQWGFISNTGNASADPFPTSSLVAGRVHANANWTTISQVEYRDSVTSTGTFSTSTAANIKTGKGENQRRIPWPHIDTLMAPMATEASALSLSFSISNANPARAEFVWRDLDSNGVASRSEGFIRLFELSSTSYLGRLEVVPSGFAGGNNEYVDWNDPVIQNQCGAFYRRVWNGAPTWQFFPVAVHRATWAWSIISGAGVPAAPSGGNGNSNDTERAAAARAILSGPTARCFPSGSPYLVNTERFSDNSGAIGTGSSHNRPFGASTAAKYGGQDTTITMTVRQCTIGTSAASPQCGGGTLATIGTWRTLSAGSELAPLDRNGRGAVLYFNNNIRISGTFAGRATVAAKGGWVSIIDHLVSAGGPNLEATDCSHLLGVIAQNQVAVDTNLITHRTRVGNGSGGSSNTQVWLGGADHFRLHGAFFSVSSYFGIQGNNFRQSNSNTWTCENLATSMGCLRHVGSAAMNSTRAFSTSNNRGARYSLTPDACMQKGYRPPLYPGTNRYKLLRNVNVRPAAIIGVNGIADYFATLQGTSDIP